MPSLCLWASSPWERFRGLLGRPPLPPGVGLWIPGCTGIHTWGMSRPIDVAFLTSSGDILEVRRGLPPWRTAFGPPLTSAVLETEIGGLVNIEPGMQVRLNLPDPFPAGSKSSHCPLPRLPEDAP